MDSQLRSTFGALGLLHDFVSQLAVAEPSATSAESLANIRWVYLVTKCLSDRHRAGTGKPEALGIKFQQPWWLGRTIAKLKAQLQGGQLRRDRKSTRLNSSHQII